ncbi:hypothetical protein [Vibrio genomosp. F10]|uniref:hypothetical protein n=1 Tax=Vibrio genomosp. F10 TaxID=723171 RepID=UPI0002FBFD8D|nr:hypothetical protein [Vibrio genomosp. F10]
MSKGKPFCYSLCSEGSAILAKLGIDGNETVCLLGACYRVSLMLESDLMRIKNFKCFEYKGKVENKKKPVGVTGKIQDMISLLEVTQAIKQTALHCTALH